MAHPSSLQNQRDQVPSGIVEARIQQLTNMASPDRSKSQASPSRREDDRTCSPDCRRTRLELSASPPVGHAYTGEASKAGSVRTRQNIRSSKSSNSIGRSNLVKSPLRHSHTVNSRRQDVTISSSQLELPASSREPHSSSLGSQTNTPIAQEVTNQQQGVLDIFDIYGVARPEGWLSDDEQRPVSRTRTIQICHSCGESLHSRTRCVKCGHEFCVKCTSEIVEEEVKVEDNEGFTTHPNTPHGVKDDGLGASQHQHVREHREYTTDQQDAIAAEQSSVHGLTDRSGRSSKSRRNRTIAIRHEAEETGTEVEPLNRLSDCIPHQYTERHHSEFLTSERCAETRCPTCQVGKYPARHCICCAAMRSLERRQTTGDVGLNNDGRNQSSNTTTAEKQREKSTKDPKARKEFSGTSASLLSGYITSAEASRTHSPSGSKGIRVIYESKGKGSAKDMRVSSPLPLGSHNLMLDRTMKAPAHRRMHDLSEDAAIVQRPLFRPHEIDKDIFFTPSGRDGLRMAKTVSGEQHGESSKAPKLAIDGIQIQDSEGSSDFSISRDPTPFPPKTPESSRRMSLLRELQAASTPHGHAKHRHERNITESSPSQKGFRSDPWPRHKRVEEVDLATPTKASKKAPWTRHSLKKVVGNVSRDSQRDMEMSDLSAWKRQLKEVDKQGNLEGLSPAMTPTPLASDSKLSSHLSPKTPHRHVGRSSDICLQCSSTSSPLLQSKDQTAGFDIESQSTNRRAGSQDSKLKEETDKYFSIQGNEQGVEPLKSSVSGEQQTKYSSVKQMDLNNETGLKKDKGKNVVYKQGESVEGMPQQQKEKSKTSSGSFNTKSRASSSQHTCEWRTRYIGLTSELEQLKTELNALEDQTCQHGEDVGSGNESNQHVCDDSGIEGLTVIVHRRYKEDIVLNTDLRDEKGKGKA
ncbi:hypothetical protein PT974_08210 [Cladobotryum mycophilum]|uniref:FYVE-type domain-containing protein n=1 Tax=Cladobotryum mycophilum TaxID=491253 RepID=A0ABR0SCQ3_9HYPO